MEKNDYELEADYGESIELDKETEEFLKKKSNVATCKIISESENRPLYGTGFFCKIPLLGKVLFTNNHILNKNSIKENEIIICLYKNELKKFEIKNRKCFTNEELDYTCIEILNEDEIEDFFEIENENSNNPKEYNGDDIALPQFPKGGPLKINAGCLVKIEGNQIFHYVTTFKGSSGSPILLLLRKYKIIGIHCAASEKLKMNRGIKIKDILDDIKKVK